MGMFPHLLPWSFTKVLSSGEQGSTETRSPVMSVPFSTFSSRDHSQCLPQDNTHKTISLRCFLKTLDTAVVIFLTLGLGVWITKYTSEVQREKSSTLTSPFQ